MMKNILLLTMMIATLSCCSNIDSLRPFDQTEAAKLVKAQYGVTKGAHVPPAQKTDTFK